MAGSKPDKQALFATVPVGRALMTMAVPTIISQLINLIYNMVDAFFIGRTGNPTMTAATSLTLTMVMFNVALSNLFGIGGGSLVARLMGMGENEEAGRVSAYSTLACTIVAALYALLIGLFCAPVLRFLGASDATIGYARAYTYIVVVLGGIPSILSLTLAHLLRNTGFSGQASAGLSLGGVINVVLDPLFMFVWLPRGQEVVGAAIATALSNLIACTYLLVAYKTASKRAPLRMGVGLARAIRPDSVRALYAVGIPSAILTGLFDLANICLNRIAAAHSDLVLAGIGIVMKVERVPNAVNIGLCQGMLPIVAYNYASGNRERLRAAIHTARMAGLAVSVGCIALFECFAAPACRLFMSTSSGNVESALATIGWATLFLRIRCIGSPLQFINYHASYSMQAMGFGRETMLHAFVRELVFYIPFMFLLDARLGEVGMAAALIAGEGCGALFALWLLRRTLRQGRGMAAGRTTYST